MKSLLAVLTDTTQMTAHLASAAALARVHDAHLDVLALGVDATPVSYGEFGAAVVLVQEGVSRAEHLATALAAAAEKLLSAESPDLRWAVNRQIAQTGGISDVVGRSARLADLVIQPHPYGRGGNDHAQTVVEAALFQGRAPVLVLPDQMARPFATPKHVVVAWNQSTQAMVAIRAALPLLKQADAVNIAVIDPGAHDPERSDPGGALCQMLARHGVHSDVTILARTLPRTSDTLQRHLMDRGADLLVMGAYGHSRLREAIFGGVTRDMLEHCTIPVLMAH